MSSTNNYKISTRHKTDALQNGFTMPELLIAVFIAGIFIFGLYLLYRGGMDSFRKSSNKSEALQGAYILYQRLQADISMCIHNEGLPIAIQNVKDGQNNQLSFYIADKSNNNPLQIKTMLVTYLFDKETMMVSRNGKVVTHGRFENIQFILDDADYQSSPPKYGNQILCAIQAVGHYAAENIKQGTGLQQLGDRSSFIASFSIPYKVEREQYPTWRLNPTSFPQ